MAKRPPIRDGRIASGARCNPGVQTKRREQFFWTQLAVVESDYAQPLKLDDAVGSIAASRRRLQRAFTELRVASFLPALPRIAS